MKTLERRGGAQNGLYQTLICIYIYICYLQLNWTDEKGKSAVLYVIKVLTLLALLWPLTHACRQRPASQVVTSAHPLTHGAHSVASVCCPHSKAWRHGQTPVWLLFIDYKLTQKHPVSLHEGVLTLLPWNAKQKPTDYFLKMGKIMALLQVPAVGTEDTEIKVPPGGGPELSKVSYF